MKRRIRPVCIVLLAAMLIGCGKKEPTKKPTVSVTPTEPVTAEPTPVPKDEREDKPILLLMPVSYGEGDGGYICQGTLELETDQNITGLGDGVSDTVSGRLVSYRVQNNANTELFRIIRNEAESEYVYLLKIGAYERRLKSIPKEGVASLEVFHAKERIVITQNKTVLLMISANPEAMVVSADDTEGAWAFRFPVKGGIVSETDASGSFYLGEEQLLLKITELSDIYDGSYPVGVIDTIRAGKTCKEWEADYVQVTKQRIEKDGKRTDCSALYQSNTVIIERVRNDAPGKVTEYDFLELSEGISGVEYFASTSDEKPAYTFSVEELDTFRAEAYQVEFDREKETAEFLKNRIPFLIIPTEYGFMERGIRVDIEDKKDYIRFAYCDGTVTGDIYAEYLDEEPVSVRLIGLGCADGRIYADGEILPGTRPDRRLHEYTYDAYGVLVKEKEPGRTVSYEYEFSDYAFGGEDDTVRHEWQKLMPYLGDAPKERAADTSAQTGESATAEDGSGM